MIYSIHLLCPISSAKQFHLRKSMVNPDGNQLSKKFTKNTIHQPIDKSLQEIQSQIVHLSLPGVSYLRNKATMVDSDSVFICSTKSLSLKIPVIPGVNPWLPRKKSLASQEKIPGFPEPNPWLFRGKKSHSKKGKKCSVFF